MWVGFKANDEEVIQAPPIVRRIIEVSPRWQADNLDIVKVADQIERAYAGVIMQFWNSMRQQSRLGELAFVKNQKMVKGMRLEFSSNQGTEMLIITVMPELFVNMKAPRYGEIDINPNYALKIDLPFDGWMIQLDGGGSPLNWANSIGVGKPRSWAAPIQLRGLVYLELRVSKLPSGVPDPITVPILGGPDDGSYTQDPTVYTTNTYSRFTWPSGLNTYSTPCFGIVPKSVLPAKPWPKYPWTTINYDLPFNPDAIGGYPASSIRGHMHHHTWTPPGGGYYATFGSETWIIAPPNTTDTTSVWWSTFQTVGNGGSVYMVISGPAMAPRTGPPPGMGPGSFTWNGITWLAIGDVGSNLLYWTASGLVDVSKPQPWNLTNTYWAYDAYSIPPALIGDTWYNSTGLTPSGYLIGVTPSLSIGTTGLHTIGVAATVGITYNEIPGHFTDTDDPDNWYGDLYDVSGGSIAATAVSPISTTSIRPWSKDGTPGKSYPIVQNGVWDLDKKPDLGELKERDILQIAVDANKGKIWFGKNGKWLSRPGKDQPQYTFDPKKEWFPAVTAEVGRFQALLTGSASDYPAPGGFEPYGAGEGFKIDFPE